MGYVFLILKLLRPLHEVWHGFWSWGGKRIKVLMECLTWHCRHSECLKSMILEDRVADSPEFYNSPDFQSGNLLKILKGFAKDFQRIFREFLNDFQGFLRISKQLETIFKDFQFQGFLKISKDLQWFSKIDNDFHGFTRTSKYFQEDLRILSRSSLLLDFQLLSAPRPWQ